MNTYIKGCKPRINFEFRRISDNSLIDPTAVYFKWKLGANGIVTTLTFGDGILLQASVGQYYTRIDASAVGIYYCLAYATGNGQSAEERTFEVVSQFP